MRINATREIKLKAVVKSLNILRTFVTKVGAKMGLNPRQTNHLKLCIDEVCSNVIRHAYKDTNIKNRDILVRMVNAEKYVETRIIDWGKPFTFDIDKTGSPDLNKYVEIKKKGGLGLYMIQKFMDEVENKREGNTNVLIMRQNVVRAESSWGLVIKSFNWQDISLRLRFSFIAAAAISALLLSVYFISTSYQKSSLEKQYYYNIKNTVSKLSADSAPYILDNNDLELTMSIKELKSKDKSIEYAGIVNSYDYIIAHTDAQQLYKTFIPPKTINKIEKYGLTLSSFNQDHKKLIYLSSPIEQAGVTIGELFIVLSEDLLQSTITSFENKYKLIFFTSFFWIIAVIGAYSLGSTFIEPLKQLTDEIRRVGKEGASGRLYFKGKGEYAEVANVFNKMMSEIKLAEVELTDTTRLKKEMQLAKSIQQTLLPHEIPKLEGYDIGAKYESAMEVGGDYYDFFKVDNNSIGIAVGDVSGKGIAGALVMTMTRTALRLEARDNKIASEVMANLNATLDGEFKKGMYITMFYVILDAKKRIINYSSAGHNPMILYRGDTGQLYNFNPKGFAVGLNLGSPEIFRKAVKHENINLRKGDLLFIYTDGITEAMNSKREEFGEARLLEAIKKYHYLPAQEICDKVLDEIKEFAGSYPQSDDITYVVVKEKANVTELNYEKRVQLFDLIEKQNESIKEACNRVGITPSQYYRLKEIKDKQGIEALHEDIEEGKRDIDRLDIEGSSKLLHLIATHPEYSVSKLHKELQTAEYGNYKVSVKMISKELTRLNLTTIEKRQRFSKREKVLMEQGKKSIFMRGGTRLQAQSAKEQAKEKIDKTVSGTKSKKAKAVFPQKEITEEVSPKVEKNKAESLIDEKLKEYQAVKKPMPKGDLPDLSNLGSYQAQEETGPKIEKNKENSIIDSKIKEYQAVKNPAPKGALPDLSNLGSYQANEAISPKVDKSKADAIIDAKLKEYQTAKKSAPKGPLPDLSNLGSAQAKEEVNPKVDKSKADAIIDAKLKEYQAVKKPTPKGDLPDLSNLGSLPTTEESSPKVEKNRTDLNDNIKNKEKM